ncbi:hypothetical protein [Streptomyces sp. ODS28]|uniref:hypothetical protein n=1 Tax=Streptomyces sp. ODS28 TaxID=3136688 RepID=UPI0031F0D5C2
MEILLRALPAFRRNSLVGGGWSPTHAGRHGPCCLTTFFIGQCVCEFRRVYLRWRRQQRQLAEYEALLWDGEAFLQFLQTPSLLPGPEGLATGGGAVTDLIGKHSPVSQAIVRLSHMEPGPGSREHVPSAPGSRVQASNQEVHSRTRSGDAGMGVGCRGYSKWVRTSIARASVSQWRK